MKKQDIEDIQSFIEDEISDYDLSCDYYIEDEILCVTFKGHFTSQQEIELNFRCLGGHVEIYRLSEGYVDCGTREFWIELMDRKLK